MGDEDSTVRTVRTSTARLRVLQGDLAQPRARPDGPSGRTRSPFPAGLVPPGLLDHLQAAVDEAIGHTRSVAPAAGPVPGDLARIYEWMDRSTRHVDAGKRRIVEAIILRQGWEHELWAGNQDVVRPVPCPACGCWSLLWDRDRRLVICSVDDCVTAGRPTAWTLRDLAERAVEKSPSRAAT